MTTLPAPPHLTLSRIEQNQRRIAILIAAAILITIPFVLSSSFLIANGITWQVTRQTHLERFHQLRLDRFNRHGDDIANHREVKVSRDAGLQEDLNAASAYTPQEKNMRAKIMAIFASGITALLGLLVWMSVTSPARKLLAAEGARPAGTPERDTQHALEELATTAGLPVPRLYVIETMALNAFSAGMNPEHSVIAVSQGLLAALDAREMRGILAHELSLIGNRETRLNMFVAWYALLLRMSYLMRRKHRLVEQLSSKHPSVSRFRRGYWLIMVPIFSYILLVSSLLAALARWAVSGGREFLADTDAAALTGDKEGMLRALAKIAGAGSVLDPCNPAFAHLYFSDPSPAGSPMGLLHGNLFAPHPPLEQRVERLAESGSQECAASVEAAFDAGRAFSREHPLHGQSEMPTAGSTDELVFVSSGNPMGRVFRVLSDGTPIYDHDSTSSVVVDRVKRGDLLVVFDDPGRMRQVITAKQIFGYIPYSVKLRQEDLLPSEIHNVGAHNTFHEPSPMAAPAVPPAAVAAAATRFGLTARQVFVCAGFGIVVFAGMLVALVEFGGR